jgi:RNA polymerase sigma-70 factor (ECF subfamily)
MADTEATNSDAAWLQAVVRQYEGHVLQYAMRIMGDMHRARDVTQDTFLQLCRQPRTRVEKNVRQWLFTVCRNRATDVLRKELRMTTLGQKQEQRETGPEANPAERAERNEVAGQATAILGTLPANQQEVIRLRLQHGLSYREISQVTGLSVSNVGVLLHKGIKSIRERLALVPGTS